MKKNVINNLIRVTFVNIVRVTFVNKMVEHNLMNSVVDLDSVVEDDGRILGHRRFQICLAMVSPGVFC